jgi:hypothetical protein
MVWSAYHKGMGELEEEMKKGNNCVIDLTKDVLPIKRKQDVKVKVKEGGG